MRFIFYYIFLRWFVRILFCAQQDPIERLYISIEGDFSGLMTDLEEAVKRVEERLEQLEGKSDKSGQGVGQSATKAGFAFGLAAGAATKLLDIVTNIAVSIPQMFAALGKEAVQANAQFETFSTQFETLLGSGALAKERLDELAQFGVETPFELPEIVEASRTLQTFGGTALATGDNLRMIGDIAAGVNQPFQSVAFWIGRMYDAMQNGQPFGEASARLQEMGALTGDTRRQLENMQKAGEDGAKIFAVFSEEVGGRFAGNMERLSKTFQGVTSNLADFRGNLLRVGGAPLFEAVKESAIDFLNVLNEYGPTVNYVAEQIGEIVAMLINFGKDEIIGKAFDSVAIFHLVESLKEGVTWLKETTGAFLDSLGAAKAFGEQTLPLLSLIGRGIAANLSITWELVKNFTGLGMVITALSRRVEEAGGFFQALQAAFIAGAQGVAIIKAAITQLTFIVDGAWEALSGLGNLLVAIATGNVGAIKDAMLRFNEGIKKATTDGIDAFNKSMLESAKAIDEATAKTEKETEAVEDNTKAKEDNADVPPPEAPLLDQSKLDSYTDQLIKATEQRDEQLAKLEQDHGQKMQQIIKDANDKALGIEEKYNDDLAKLTQETETKRLDIIENTRRELADLAKSTDQELTTKRKQFNTDERRETEDHLKEMRRLQEDHLLSLEEAVRDRDAGAIVDLQRRFQTESARKEEDFQQGQNRDKADFNDELNQIRENEAQRRQEILGKQAEQLADLQQHEQDKRLELDMRRQEENEKLQQNLQDQLLREQENYAQRKQALDEALQQQLETIAEGLAKEKDITEEGAREILEKFDEYFGIGGDIDQLMADFARRRKIRADITVAFQGTGMTEPETQPTTPQDRLGEGLAVTPGGKRLGGVQEFATGGTLIADKPTLAIFGEKGPEVVQFTPMSQLSSPGAREPGRMVVEMTGSAPPGIGASERDQIAAVLLSALQETGVLG